MIEYHHLNKPQFLWLIITLQSMGEMSTWLIQSLVYFHFFEALHDIFEVQFFSGLHFYTTSYTLIACRAMQLRFFLKWKQC